jgi:excisionase family DNA binding protein
MRVDALMTKSQVATALAISRRTVDRLRAAGQLKAFKVRGRIRFDAADVRAFLEEMKREARR